MTHDYKRNGTTTLFAALEILQGKVIGRCYQRHRHQELMAKRMHTSRSQLDRILDPDNDKVQLDTVFKAAHALGREVKLELV
jgi:hypothetical protein